MQKKKQFRLFPAYSDRFIFIAVLLLVVYGSFMIASAEMGSAAGDTSVVLRAIIKQLIFVSIGLISMAILARFPILRIKDSLLYNVGFVFMTVCLLATRFFGSINGAYAWFNFKLFTIQPSEFAKVYIIIAFAKALSKDKGIEENRKTFKQMAFRAITFFLIVLLWQKDFGSALILAGISFVLLLASPLKGLKLYQRWMMIVLVIGAFCALLLLSPIGTAFLMEHNTNYQIARFLTSANPFLYQYDDGYHLIMGLVSFAQGGLFGLGYGNSIHKYMNFPNPSNDFILPVIVEEMGVVFGLIPVLVMYGLLVIPLIIRINKTKKESSKLVYLGTFMYFALHFVLNVGGVSGLLPLTGVPLLLLSSGGSSTVAFMLAIGVTQSEIVTNQKEIKHASHSR